MKTPQETRETAFEFMFAHREEIDPLLDEIFTAVRKADTFEVAKHVADLSRKFFNIGRAYERKNANDSNG